MIRRGGLALHVQRYQLPPFAWSPMYLGLDDRPSERDALERYALGARADPSGESTPHSGKVLIAKQLGATASGPAQETRPGVDTSTGFSDLPTGPSSATNRPQRPDASTRPATSLTLTQPPRP